MKNRGKNEHGFTLTELLIVVAIIGVLASIAIPQYAFYRKRAFDAASLSDVKNLRTNVVAYRSDKQQYPLFATPVMLAGSAIIDLDGVVIYSLSNNVQGTIQSTADSFAVLMLHVSGSKLYGAASDSSKTFMHSTGISTAILASDSSAFAGWDSM